MILGMPISLKKMRIAWSAIFDRRTPLLAKGLLLGGLLYGILPIDFIPDILPLIGIADDGVIILIVIFAFLHFSKSIRKELERSEQR